MLFFSSLLACLSLCSAVYSVSIAKEAKPLEAGVNRIGPNFHLPQNYNWSGAPKNFKEVHSSLKPASEDGGFVMEGDKKIWYFVMEHDLAVKYNSSIPVSKPSIRLDMVDLIDPVVLMKDGASAYLKGKPCSNKELTALVQNTTQDHQYAHLHLAVVLFTKDDDSDLSEEMDYKVFTFPLELGNGKCDVVYGPLKQQ